MAQPVTIVSHQSTRPLVAADFDLVIGLTGLKASGKDVLADRLSATHGFVVRRCSDEVRVEATTRGLAIPTINELIQIGNEGRMFGGVAYWAERALRTAVAQGHRRIIINGLRHPGETAGMSKLAGDKLTLVGIVGPTDLRAQRLIQRGRPGDPTDYASFLKLDDDDRGIGQPEDGQQVDRTLALVPYDNIYNNCGAIEDYFVWCEELAQRILGLT